MGYRVRRTKEEIKEELDVVFIDYDIDDKYKNRLVRLLERCQFQTKDDILENINDFPVKIRFLKAQDFSNEKIESYVRKYLAIFFLSFKNYVKTFYTILEIEKKCPKFFNFKSTEYLGFLGISIEEIYARICHQLSLPEKKRNFSMTSIIRNKKYYQDYGVTKSELIELYSMNKYIDFAYKITFQKSKKMDLIVSQIINYHKENNTLTPELINQLKDMNYKQLLEISNCLQLTSKTI